MTNAFFPRCRGNPMKTVRILDAIATRYQLLTICLLKLDCLRLHRWCALDFVIASNAFPVQDKKKILKIQRDRFCLYSVCWATIGAHINKISCIDRNDRRSMAVCHAYRMKLYKFRWWFIPSMLYIYHMICVPFDVFRSNTFVHEQQIFIVEVVDLAYNAECTIINGILPLVSRAKLLHSKLFRSRLFCFWLVFELKSNREAHSYFHGIFTCGNSPMEGNWEVEHIVHVFGKWLEHESRRNQSSHHSSHSDGREELWTICSWIIFCWLHESLKKHIL